MEKYILDANGNPVPADLDTWAKWYETNRESRRVALDEFDNIRVSTVFLALNHNWGDGPPLLFETMVFGGKMDEYMRRYSTRKEAENGHKEVVSMVKQYLAIGKK